MKAWIVSVVVLLSFCQYREKHVVKKQDDARIMLHHYHEAMAEKGLMAEFDYLDSSSQFFWIPPGYGQALSYDSVKTIITLNSRQYKQVDFKWDTLTVQYIASDVATFYGQVTGQMTDTTDVTNSIVLLESGTLIKRKEGWKLLSGQSKILP